MVASPIGCGRYSARQVPPPIELLVTWTLRAWTALLFFGTGQPARLSADVSNEWDNRASHPSPQTLIHDSLPLFLASHALQFTHLD